MEIEAYIVKRVNLLMNATDAKILKRLEGGMSNYTYVVECQGIKYTYRVPGKLQNVLSIESKNGTTFKK